jgi:hypothetical protein
MKLSEEAAVADIRTDAGILDAIGVTAEQLGKMTIGEFVAACLDAGYNLEVSEWRKSDDPHLAIKWGDPVINATD